MPSILDDLKQRLSQKYKEIERLRKQMQEAEREKKELERQIREIEPELHDFIMPDGSLPPAGNWIPEQAKDEQGNPIFLRGRPVVATRSKDMKPTTFYPGYSDARLTIRPDDSSNRMTIRPPPRR
jgi:hypothetical protein